jgi:hypothetical protein
MLLLMSDFIATIMLEELMKLRELQQGRLFLPMIICYIINKHFCTYYKLSLVFVDILKLNANILKNSQSPQKEICIYTL